MAKQRVTVETFLKHLRDGVREVAALMPDARERAGFYAIVATTLVGKVLESLPEIGLRDATGARDLVEEAREALGDVLRALRDVYERDRPASPGPAPSLN